MKSKRINKIVFSILGVVLSALLILFIVTSCMFSPLYFWRNLTHWDSSIKDYRYFPKRKIAKSSNPLVLKENFDPGISQIQVEFSSAQTVKSKNIAQFVNDTETTSFLIVKNNQLIYEQYANGYTEHSVNTSFSIAKSVVSLLIGKAIEEGFIGSVIQPISDFIAELSNTSVGKTTIEQLLLMRSDISYEENGFLWFGDDSLTYWSPNLRELSTKRTKIKDGYSGKFHYNNYHPLLLGMILETSTGMSVSEYFGTRIWQKIGAEYDASWSLDSEKSGFEKMESGINFQSKDFIKIGCMLLGNGSFNGEQIINESWINRSVYSQFPIISKDYAGTLLQDRNIGYKYMWYSMPAINGGHDFFAWGKSDQILYISPSNNTVILRTGFNDGKVSDWPETLRKIVSIL